MDKPKFDPSKPFNTASAKPKFDPSAPFDSGGSSASAAPVDDSVVEEMHPNFSTADRLIVKNFAGNNQAAVNYLQKQHPDLEIKTKEFSDKILARKRDGSEKDYKVLDPDTGFFSTDFLRDVGDIGFDIASGVGTGAATAAGGIFGAGVGSIPAAAAAGAASSAGLEAGRQGLGKMFGIEQDIDMGDVGFAGAAGALSPLLLGTGATTAQAAAKSLNPFKGSLSTLRGMAAPELDDAGKALLSSQRGLIGRGYDAYKGGLAPKLGSMASGVSEDTIKTMRGNFDEMLKIEKDPMGLTKMVNSGTQDAGKLLRAGKKAEWETVEQGLKQAGDEIVDITAAKDAFKNAIDEAMAGGDDELAAELQRRFNTIFTKRVEKSGTVVPIRNMVDEFIPGGETVVIQNGMEMMPSKRPDGSVIYDLITGAPEMVPADRATLSSVRGAGDTVTKDVFSGFETLGGGAGREELEFVSAREAAQKYKRLADMAGLNKMEAGAVKGGIGNRFSPMATYEDKASGQAAASAWAALGESLDKVLPTDSVAARQRYGLIANDEKQLGKYFGKTPSKINKKLRNLHKPTNQIDQEFVNSLDSKYGSNLIDLAKKSEAYATFAKPEHLPLSRTGGVSGLARSAPLALAGAGLGYWVGANSGIGMGGAGVGGTLGMGMGAFLGGPAAMRKYMQMQRGMTKATTTLKDSGLRPNQVVVPSWLMMQQRKIEE